MEYDSASAGCWIPCSVTAVGGRGEVQVDCKPGYWFRGHGFKTKLRKPMPAGKGVGKGGGYAAAPTPPLARQGTQATQQGLFVGQTLQYNSVSAGGFIPCKVNAVAADGSFEVDCKPGYFFPAAELALKFKIV